MVMCEACTIIAYSSVLVCAFLMSLTTLIGWFDERAKKRKAEKRVDELVDKILMREDEKRAKEREEQKGE